VVITAERPEEQPCSSEPWTRFSACTDHRRDSEILTAMGDYDLTRPELGLPVQKTLSSARTKLVKLRLTTAITMAAVIIFFLITLSPLFLRMVSHFKGVNWVLISNVGQAYGGASAILAGVALIGISGSLVIQMRQSRNESIRAVRERHQELLNIVLSNPRVYAPVMGTRTPSTADEVRQFAFATMFMNYSLMGYEMGVITDQAITQEILPSAFSSASFRDWWAVSARYWLPENVGSKKARQFACMLDRQHEISVASGRAPVQRYIQDGNLIQPSRWTPAKSAATGMIIGIIIRSAFRRKH
jgi:hypothetical protein